MDPFSISASVIALLTTVEKLIKVSYQYGKEASEAKKEVKLLCSELFALKGALECTRLNIDQSLDSATDDEGNGEGRGDRQGDSSSTLFGTREFRDMVEATEELLADLLLRFTKMQTRRSALTASLMWPFLKEEVENDIKRLERLKSYFVLTTTSENLEVSRQLHRQFHSLAQVLSNQQQQQDQKAQDEFRKNVKCWLAPYNPDEAYRAAIDADHPGTGQWFLRGHFSRWLDGRENSAKILLLKGKPGIGKTTLMAAAIHHQKEQRPDQGVVAYYFCSFTDLSSQEPVNVLGSILAQMCQEESSLWHLVDPLYREANSGPNLNRLTLEQARLIFSKACNALSGLTIFLDAVNESEHSAAILSTMWSLSEESPYLRVVISSTEELFASPFQDKPPSLLTVEMTPEEVALDIRDYVEYWLGNHVRLRGLPRRLKAEIRSRLLLSSEGMFRWVHCQLQALTMQKTPLGIKAALDAVPATLEQTYCNILLRISQDDKRIAQQALLWLAYSTRPLTFAELCEAAIIDESSPGVDENARLLQPEDLLLILASLVHYDSRKDTVILAHSSVLLYLTSRNIQDSRAEAFYIDPSMAHTSLTRKCISYLCSEELDSGYCSDEDQLDEREADLPMLEYAVRNWRTHAKYLERQKHQIDNNTKQLLLRFFSTTSRPGGGNFGSWVQLYMPNSGITIENSPPTYYAARFGLLEVLKMILSVQGPQDLECRGGRRGSTPLHVASAFGHMEIVNVLLTAGADIHEHNDKGECALQWAVLYGSEDVVRRLLQAGADPNFRNKQGRTPLYYAVRNQQEQCAKLLLVAGASQDNIDGQGKSASKLGEEGPMNWTEALGYDFHDRRHFGINETLVKDWKILVSD